MKRIWQIAWHRFNLIQGAVSDTNARMIAVIFYFTILLPFGVAYTLLGDPLRVKPVTDENGNTRPVGQAWHERHPVHNDIDSARQQG